MSTTTDFFKLRLLALRCAICAYEGNNMSGFDISATLQLFAALCDIEIHQANDVVRYANGLNESDLTNYLQNFLNERKNEH